MQQLEIIKFEDRSRWNEIVKSFPQYDVYYLNEYVAPFVITGKNESFLINFKNNNFELCYVIEKSDIADFEKFENKLTKNKLFDISTPYGYGGPLVKNYDAESIKLFFEELKKWAKNENIISQFFRFHPLIENYKHFEEICEIKNLKKTVVVNLENEQAVFDNMASTCRNRIRKAINSGIKIEIDNSKKSQERFIELYKLTMDKNNATDFYYFNDKFFEELFKTLGESSNLFNSVYENKIISSAIVLNCNKHLHYHLGCTDVEYIKLAPNNLLFYEIALYGVRNGYTKYHLGGGTGIEDSLLTFKKTFNKNGLIDFYIGRNIFDKIKYDELMQLRKQLDDNFNLNNTYMIGYRA